MMDYQRLFHTGIRVPDLDVGMEEMGAALGITWAEARENPEQAVWTPETGQQSLHLRYVYSAEGPQHIELLEGPAGSIWDGSQQPGVHHLGVWVDDVAEETQRCIDHGWRVAAAQKSPDDGYGSFTYVVPPSGTIVELVSDKLLPGFQAWWAGE